MHAIIALNAVSTGYTPAQNKPVRAGFTPAHNSTQNNDVWTGFTPAQNHRYGNSILLDKSGWPLKVTKKS